jgi:hypothetical protein
MLHYFLFEKINQNINRCMARAIMACCNKQTQTKVHIYIYIYMYIYIYEHAYMAYNACLLYTRII